MSKVCSGHNLTVFEELLSDYEKSCFGLRLVLSVLDDSNDDKQRNNLLSLVWDFSANLEQNFADLHTLHQCLCRGSDMDLN